MGMFRGRYDEPRSGGWGWRLVIGAVVALTMVGFRAYRTYARQDASNSGYQAYQQQLQQSYRTTPSNTGSSGNTTGVSPAPAQAANTAPAVTPSPTPAPRPAYRPDYNLPWVQSVETDAQGNPVLLINRSLWDSASDEARASVTERWTLWARDAYPGGTWIAVDQNRQVVAEGVQAF